MVIDWGQRKVSVEFEMGNNIWSDEDVLRSLLKASDGIWGSIPRGLGGESLDAFGTA